LRASDPSIWKADMKALKIASGVVAVIVVVAAVLLTVGTPVGFLASTIQQRVERETGYRVTVRGWTRIALLPSPNITMSDVTLQAPTDEDGGNRLSIGRIQADTTLASLWSGEPEITELVIDRPAARIPLHRHRRPVAKPEAATPAPNSDSANSRSPTIRRITVSDGTITLFNSHDHVEDHIEGISARASFSENRHLSLDGNAHAGGHPLTFNLKASLPGPSQQGQTFPAELSLEAPGLLQAQLTSKADVRINGSTLLINGLSGTIDSGGFDGWASVDFASKPLVKLDLDFHRLGIATTATQTTPQAAAAAWSDDRFELIGLNYVDAQVRLSTDELNIGNAHFAPAAIEASLAGGILKGRLSDVGAYGGKANGTVDIDVSSDTPVYTIHGDLDGVRALPLLSSTAGFDKLDGKLQATIDVRSNGQSQQTIMSNLSGTVVADFHDGAIRGLNVAQMIRSLTSGMLSGWQEGQDKTTDLTELSASFRIDKGQANTTDLNLVGPLVKVTGNGTIDLGAQTLALHVEPKLVMTTEGQGRKSDSVAFGIPVVIDGPWSAPRIYPDISGILDNPEAAYARLKQLGKGLFAPGEPGNDNAGGGNGLEGLGAAIGNLIQQGLKASQGRNGAPNNPSAPGQNDPAKPDPNSRPMNDIMRQLFGR
jgi:AsmA protein